MNCLFQLSNAHHGSGPGASGSLYRKNSLEFAIVYSRILLIPNLIRYDSVINGLVWRSHTYGKWFRRLLTFLMTRFELLCPQGQVLRFASIIIWPLNSTPCYKLIQESARGIHVFMKHTNHQNF